MCGRLAHLVLLVCLFLALPVRAHTEQEDTSLSITFRGDELTLSYRTAFPSMASYVQLKQLDADGDQSYSKAEKQVFLERRLGEYLQKVDLRFNDTPVKLSAPLREVEVSSSLGVGEMAASYSLVGRLPHPPEPGDRLYLKDPAFGWNRYEVTGDRSGNVEVDESSIGDTMTLRFDAAAVPEGPVTKPVQGGSEKDPLLAMVGTDMTPTVLVGTLGLAFVLGALHALTPGHGKTMVAAYLVGARGTVRQAVLLGIVVTITHTASVFLLGLACMVAFQYVVPDKIIPWLGFVSGLMVSGVGATLLLGKLAGKDWGHGHSHEHGGHSHGHSHSHRGGGHSHDHPHSHSHRDSESLTHSHPAGTHRHALIAHPRSRGDANFDVSSVEIVSAPQARQVYDASAEPDEVSLWALVGLGVSGGLVPCPEALVVLLAAISLNKLLLGMLVLVAFSTGLASLLVLIGILVVSATRVSRRFYPSDQVINRVSMVSYVVICGMGLVIAIRSLVSGGVITINL